MATITIRNVDDATHQRLKREAKQNHRSLESEMRARIERPVVPVPQPVSNWAEELERISIDMGPDYEGSVALIRTIRDEE